MASWAKYQPVLMTMLAATVRRWRKTLREGLDTVARVLVDAGIPEAAAAGAVLLGRRGRWADAERICRDVILRRPKSTFAREFLAKTLRRQKKTGQEVEVLRAACEVAPNNVRLRYRFALALFAMGRHEEAVCHLREAARRRPRSPERHYRLAQCLNALGRTEEAETAFARAVAADWRPQSRRLGRGYFYERHELWQEASAAYELQLEIHPTNAELLAHHAHCLERCYRFVASERSYRAALRSRPQAAQWRARLGFVLEKMEKWSEAAEAYEMAAEGTKRERSGYYRYRTGYCLTRAGQFNRACQAFSVIARRHRAKLQQDETTLRRLIAEQGYQPEYCRDLGHRLLAKGQLEEATWYFEAAAARAATHDASIYFGLGRARYGRGQLRAAVEAFLQTRIIQRNYGVSDRPLHRHSSFRQGAHYIEYSETLPIQQNVVLYESYHGRSMSCNPYALFRALLSSDEEAHRSLLHVWAVNAPHLAPLELLRHPRVVFVRRESDGYLRHLATAKYLINNTSFSSYFSRRDEQLYLNTWHGTPLKSLGADVVGSLVDWRNVARNFLHATHLLSPNPHTLEKLVQRHHIGGICTAAIIADGYPRIDLTLKLPDQERVALRRRLGIEGETVVLYAPTFRGQVESAAFQNVERLENDIAKLSGLRCKVLFRAHYFLEAQLSSGKHRRVCVVPSDIDTNVLLSVVDVLITDYSSVCVDFMATGRPIVYYVWDEDEYARSRGLYISPRDLAGHVCLTMDEIVELIDSGRVYEIDPSRTEAVRKTYCPWDDGEASWRVIRKLFGGSIRGDLPASGAPRVLFYAGKWMTNGITHSFLRLMDSLDHDRFRCFVTVEPDLLRGDQERIALFGRLNPRVRVLGRVGAMPLTLEERYAREFFSRANEFSSDDLRAVFDVSSRREAKRMFGNAGFDYVVNFDGYGHFWPAVLAGAGGAEVRRRSCYLHNDMMGELETRFRSLSGTFVFYREYDALVSVSEGVCNVNREKLGLKCGLEPGRFRFCNNLIDPEGIRQAAFRPVEVAADARLLANGKVSFLCVGRLSPEKAQARLVRAMAGIRQQRPNVQLLLIGDGPEETRIRQLILKLGIEDCVHLLGRRGNPYPHIRMASCLVLSSRYEGQGIVLLEALTLGTPIVCTDFACARDALADTGALIVKSSEAGLRDGLERFLAGGVVPRPFDAEGYVRHSLEMFYSEVLGLAASGIASGGSA